MSNNLNDEVGGANLFNGSNYSFVPDRCNSLNSAVYLNKGYLQVPPGVYFKGDFTVTAWIYLKSYQNYSRLFDFGNGFPSDNVVMYIHAQIGGITSNGSNSTYIATNSTISLINLNQWYFVSFVLGGNTCYIYVNGGQVARKISMNVPKNLTRTSNFIGKSNSPTNPNADAIYDEISIYQVALPQTDIMNMYNGK